MPNIQFRFATPDDVPAMLKIINGAYRGVPGTKAWTSEGHLVGGLRVDHERLLHYLSEKDSWFTLMLLDEKIVGSVYLTRESSDVLYFGMFAVDPKLQAQSLGKTFLAHIEEQARYKMFKRIRITVVHPRRELIAYYERRGFVKTGITEPFPFNNDQEGRPLVENLQMVEMVKTL